MVNAISNAIFNIYKRTAENFNKVELPKAPCPQCGAMMRLSPLGHDGRMAQWHCQRCKFNQLVRMQ